MNRAFLSHSSKQKELVRLVANNLGKARCVFDAYEFESGMPILDEIIKGINSSDIFVFFISNDALNSEWVQKEITGIKNLIDTGIGKKFYPILVDNSIEVSSDSRIPEWIRRYLLNPITEHYLITKKIKQRLREVSIEQNPLFKAKEQLFVGRQDILDQLESKLYSISDSKPRSIIVSGMEGIGRRTFLKRALKWDGKINEYYDPIFINLDTKDSIEDFIIKLQDFKSNASVEFLEQLSNLDYEEKVEEAKRLLINVKNCQEYIFIIDSGCIIKPSKQIANWYLEIIDDEDFENVFTLSIASRFRPSNELLRKNNDVIHFYLSNLSEKDTEKLFVKYCTLLKLDLKKEQSEKILQLLNGIPAQVHYAVELIRDYGIIEALRLQNDIVDFGETQVFYTIELIKQKGNFAYELLVLISNFEFISYDFVHSIVGNTDNVNELLDDFYIAGVFDLVGANKEYIKVHYPIADYLTRSKVKLNPEFRNKLRNQIQNFVKEESTIKDFQDVSELLYNIKGAIIEGHHLPEKYYIPSFVLKTIVELYYLENYPSVISLVDKVLENSRKLDTEIIREFRYWLCLSLARKSDARFELEVQNLDGADYNYLYGFYFRFKKQYDNAETYLRGALLKNSGFQRAKRELVNILLLKSNYAGALESAKANYENQKLNAFHIQAYFICITRKKFMSKDDKIIIEELLKNIDRSFDFRAKEIASVMKGEYEYYVKNDIGQAITILRECIDHNKRKHYPMKALEEIYNKGNMFVPANMIREKNKNVIETFDE